MRIAELVEDRGVLFYTSASCSAKVRSPRNGARYVRMASCSPLSTWDIPVLLFCWHPLYIPVEAPTDVGGGSRTTVPALTMFTASSSIDHDGRCTMLSGWDAPQPISEMAAAPCRAADHPAARRRYPLPGTLPLRCAAGPPAAIVPGSPTVPMPPILEFARP